MRSHLRREGKSDREPRRQRVFEHRSVLVTGAGGSIGSLVCHQAVSENASRLVLLSLTEAGLYNIDRALRRNYAKYRDTKIVPVLGDYGDEALMEEALTGIDLVVHAGAHKHVPICESNPVAAIRNNVVGTFTLMNAASKLGVKQFCAISSDKAVKPSSIMGATKRVVEMMSAMMGEVSQTRFFVVRFGNVLDSAGSVMPLWREQIASGGPLTLTDERCERYFMSICDAVDLVCEVIGMSPQGGVFVLDMGKPKRLIDIAHRLIKECGKQIRIEVVGLRPGEKLTEELFHGGTLEATRNPKISLVREDAPKRLDYHALERLIRSAIERRMEPAVHTLWEIAR